MEPSESKLANRPQSHGLNHSGASTDDQLVGSWLRRYENPSTQKAYERDIRLFRDALGPVPLRALTVCELQDWCESLRLDGASVATQVRRISAVKSLLSYAQKTGYLTFNVGAAVRTPRRLNELAERILTEEQVVRVINAAAPGHDEALLRVLYVSGARLNELAQLCWKHVHEAPEGCCRITLHGKGNKTRHVLLTATTTRCLLAQRQDAGEDAPVFFCRRRKTAPATWRAIERTVSRYTVQAGIASKVSPHWFRHAHASHAMDRGAPLHLVQATLGHASPATTGRYLHARPTESSGKYLAI